MSESEFEVGGPIPDVPGRYHPVFSQAMPLGTPICAMDAAEAPASGVVPGAVLPAKANSANTTYTFGVVAQPDVAAGARGEVCYAGPLTLSAADWAAVNADGGNIVQGSTYYVSAAHQGKLTATPPDSGGQFVAAIGYAMSTETMFIQPTFATAA